MVEFGADEPFAIFVSVNADQTPAHTQIPYPVAMISSLLKCIFALLVLFYVLFYKAAYDIVHRPAFFNSNDFELSVKFVGNSEIKLFSLLHLYVLLYDNKKATCVFLQVASCPSHEAWAGG